MRPKHGFSLLELLLSLAILLASLVPLYQTFAVTAQQTARLDAMIVARNLADSILEQVLHRFDIEESRFFELTSSPEQIRSGIQDGSYRDPFLALAQPRSPVISAVGTPNPYFDLAAGPPMPLGPEAGNELEFWRGFSYEVRVDFTMRAGAGDTPQQLDTDGDGVREVDLGRVEVEVFYDETGGQREPRSAARLTTFVVVPDKQPGLKAMSQILEGT